jgi:hypothetical protein
MLPFQVIPLLRKGDPVSAEDCLKAMLEEGASKLFPDGTPELRFASQSEAKKSTERLVMRLPRSEPVWAVLRESGRIESVGDVE